MVASGLALGFVRRMEDEKQIAARLGATIREARKARRWTQASLAEKLDVSVTYVGMVERGENLASLPLIVKLGKLFGMSVAALIGEPPRDAWAGEVLDIMRGLFDEERRTVLAMLRGLALASTASSGVRRRRGRRK